MAGCCARTPHGCHDADGIAEGLARAGFASPPEITTVAERIRAASARIAALAYCQGTPLRREIEAPGTSRLAEATDIAAAAIEGRFGVGAVEGKIQAHVVALER